MGRGRSRGRASTREERVGRGSSTTAYEKREREREREMAGSDVEAPAPASLEVVKKANSMDVVASLRNVNDMKAMDDPKMIGSIASIEGSLKSLASKVSGTSAS